jgi:hypothetical protein
MGRLHTIGRKLKSVFVVGLIFFSGLVVGWGLSASATMKDITTKAFGEGPVPVRRLLVQHAKDGLELDHDQQKLFTQILNETGLELNNASKPVQPQIAQIMERAELRLRAVLRSEQTGRFDGWAKHARERWAAALADAEKPAVALEK